ncbi:hypothetical protein [Polyangium sp. y55x31]|uniref:lipoyl protein ligase domain-containing protein n=1 Tax=Polyangium sp. y55x31 TaxID=3042688 RepID=UPI002482E75D|nr:hypothetical protein [Polyangium sp. y55x31]MDI1483091.1 hypothetical protein [Polyangium sp. y55x31]
MHAIELKKRAIPEALALGPALLERAAEAQAAHVALSLVDGSAVVLGAAQRAGRVVDLAACAQRGIPILRRATTGTAAWLGGRGLVVTLVLPHVAALVADATPRTLLNRNVRPLLGGFTRAGMLAHYFGREWITLRRRPAVLLGFDVAESGAVLVEAFVGYDAAIALPEEITTESERAIDRFLGKKPASLAELSTDAPIDLDRFAHALLEGLRARIEMTRTAMIVPSNELDTRPFAPIDHALDPVPDGLILRPAVRVPIGWIEAAFDGAQRAWLGGDVLAPRWALARIATQGDAGLPEIPLEGATIADLLACGDRS